MNNQYYYRHQRPNRPKPRRKLPKRLGTLIVVIGIIFLIISVVKINGRTVYAHLTESSSQLLQEEQNQQAKQNEAKLETLKSAVNSIINNNSGINFEVSAIDITGDNKQLDFGQSGPMAAASVSKILTAADFLQEVEKGQQSLNETLEDGNTASYDLQQMIVVSDDNAWESLNDQLTYIQIQSYADQIGVNSYQWQNNTLSAYDTANMLAKLWGGKLLNKTNTDLILGYMKQANYRQYIVPAVPSYDTIYHKIGLYNDNVNDAAIISNGKQTISLVIFTNGNGTYDWQNRATLMQQITTAFLSYYGLSH